MNKKNITINTDFFDSDNQAKFIESSEQNTAIIESKQVTSRIDHYQNNSVQNSLSNYRYEIMPDGLQSHEQYHIDSSQQVLARKLHSANDIENILSRAQARLFIAWWEELISKLHQLYYSSQEYKSIQQAQKQQIMEDYNNVFNNQDQQANANQTDQEIKQNAFASRQNQGQSIEDRKRQVIERQKQGITLDSLGKLKSSRSKSGRHQKLSKKAEPSLKPNQQSKETFLNGQLQQKSLSGVSRKSYRDKFIEYKHRSKSKEPGMPKSQTYTKFASYYQPLTAAQQANTLNRTYTTNKIRNVQSATNIQESKNDILRNINHLLMDREDIYQGQDYRYYINQRDSSKQIYTFDTNSYHNYPGSSYSRPVKMAHNQQMTEMQSTHIQDDDLVRARLIEEIVEKLKYSKIRLQEIHKNQPKNEELEMMRKLARLQKVIMELKTQKQFVEPETRIHPKTTEQQLYTKFLQQMAAIKAQINLIKNLRQSAPHPATQLQPNIADNSSSHIITEQQKLLSNYQREYERLLNQKQKVAVVPKQPETLPNIKKSNDGKHSLSQQSVETGKNATKKVGWDDQKADGVNKNIHQTTNMNQFSNQTVLLNTFNRNAYSSQQDYKNYRYTRRKILEKIGMRTQVQQQERIYREIQARKQLDQERREAQVKEMTEKVKMAKKLQSNNDGFDEAKTIRQRHEEHQKQKIDIDEDMNKNFFCQLFPCK